jgi:hypothetical protein
MRRVRMFAVAFALLAGSAVSMVSAEVATIKGEVVDQQCFLKDKSRGADHKDCATGCAKKGNPVAIVTEAGDVYTITGSYAANKNAKLIDFVSKTVEAKGEVTEKDGKKTIDVSSLTAAQ